MLHQETYLNLKGKRKKRKDPCPNPLFMQWITEWRDDAAAKGMKSKYVYNKALMSLKKYPLKLSSGKECKLLENFGDKICKMLDKKLEEYITQYGTTDPVEGYLTIPIPSKRQKMRKKDKLDKINFTSLPSGGTVRSDTCVSQVSASSDNEEEDKGRCHDKLQQRSDTSGPPSSQGGEYIPKFRSGSYAILLALYRHKQADTGGDHMSKVDLIQQAQPLADKSFTEPDAGGRYTAWSSMGSLIKKGLVIKQGNPARYSLTSAGLSLAGHLAMNTENQHESYISSIRSHNPKHQSAVNCVLKTDDVIELDDLSDSQTASNRIEEKTGTETESETSADNNASRLKFSYVDEAGSLVCCKDKAAKIIDDELSTGLLVKCKYLDLLMSAVSYRLDTSRRTDDDDDIFAFTASRDAPKYSTDVDQMSSNPPSHCQPSCRPTSKVTPSVGTVTVAPLGKQPASGQTSSSPVHGIEATNGKDNCIFLKADQTEAASKFKFKNTGTVFKPLPHACDVSDDEQLPDLPAVTCQTELSQSQAGTGDDVTQDVTNPLAVQPQFVLEAGCFEIILCVDNQEFYGGGNGNKKQLIVNELKKSGVRYDIRPLSIGDFCWIAHSNQGFPELVLDYIIERKRMDDLAGSIIDGRFKEQKFRLKNCGLQHPIYLVEDYGSNQHFSIAEDSLFQAITNTQIIDKFYVKRTGNGLESAAYLTVMTKYLQSLYAHKMLCAVSKSELEKIHKSSKTNNDGNKLYLMTFEEFNQASVKTRALSVREMFAKQLCQLHGLTPDKAVAITEKYPTPTSLFQAYKRCASDKDKQILLATIKFGPLQRNIGVALSKSIYHLYNTVETS